MKKASITLPKKAKKIRFSLRTRLTLLVGVVVLGSILIAFFFSALIGRLFPAFAGIPQIIQLNLFSFVVATVSTVFLSKIFFDPIKTLREGMARVAKGDFTVHLETHSSSAEIREVFAGFHMMVKELQATEILQSDFVSNVSHEFKTPLSAIEGYSALLAVSEPLSEEQSEYVEKIRFNTARLSTLVSGILLLSKIENQSIQTHCRHFSLDEQIRSVLVDTAEEWEKKHLEPEADLEAISYFGSEPLMYHVFSNLVGNAVKFSPEGGRILLNLKKEGIGSALSLMTSVPASPRKPKSTFSTNSIKGTAPISRRETAWASPW